jgi:hypothetical protein
VDLRFSGTVPLVVRGNVGQCMLGTTSTGDISFGWGASESDAPGLGDSLTFVEPPGTDNLDAKWAIHQVLAFFGTMSSGYTYGPDHKSIQFDADFPPSDTKTEHIRGVITCP